MSQATTAVAETAPRHAAGDDPGDRGQLDIADRVVERVAGYAVTLVDGASAAPRRVLGVSVGSSRPEADADVDARVQGLDATVQATIAIRWPANVRTTAQAVRDSVRREVDQMTGLTVEHIDVTVVSMTVPRVAGSRVR